ncbi:MAG TPA: single-stranded DNA-binding protein [Solirubrobacteraceae bacterium]|jgi:single-strand DNA-binding protein
MYEVNINRVVVSGYLTRDPQLYTLPGGEVVCNLRVACNTTNHRVTQDGCKDKVNYFDIKVYGADAENIGHCAHKGNAVMVEGRLDWREWETIEGRQAQSVCILAEALEPLEAVSKDHDVLDVDWDALLASMNVISG